MAAPDRSDTSTGDFAVSLDGVWKVYRQRQRSARARDALKRLLRPVVREVEALRGIDLRVQRGEIVAYAGANGAGKSTTIKLLSSLLSPDRGRVRALGMDPVRERLGYVARIGVVFGQRTELYWDHPLASSFEWKRVVWNVPDDTYRRMLGFVRELLGLDEFFHSLARELSLGQRMRADIGLALIHEPELLLLDEPTLGLDVLARRRIIGALKALNRERALTVVVTSHDMDELEQLAGRIVMLHRGEIAFDGDFEQLRREAAGRRVLSLETGADACPELAGAQWMRSDAGRHTYEFDVSRTRLGDLLRQAEAQGEVLDVETHRPPIDEVVADLYERWHGTAPEPGAAM